MLRRAWGHGMGSKRRDFTESAMAEAIGRRILDLRGSNLIEILYFLEEENSLEMLRAFSTLSFENQAKLIDFLKETNRKADVTLRVSRAGIKVQPGG